MAKHRLYWTSSLDVIPGWLNCHHSLYPSSPKNFGASRLVPANLGKATSPKPEKKGRLFWAGIRNTTNSKIWDNLGTSIDSIDSGNFFLMGYPPSLPLCSHFFSVSKMRRFRSTAKSPVGDLMTGFRTFQWSNLACPGLWLGGSCYYITNEMVKTSSNADMNIFVFTKVIIPPPICRNIPSEFFCQFFVTEFFGSKSCTVKLNVATCYESQTDRKRKVPRFQTASRIASLLGVPSGANKKHWAKRDFRFQGSANIPVFNKHFFFVWYFLPSMFLKTYYPKKFRKI